MERPDILKADPVYRRKVLIWIFIIALGGSLCLILLMPFLENYLASHKPEVAFNIIKYTLLILMIIPALFSLYLIRIALRTIKHCQFPPPGIKVVKDTRILYDDAAKSRAVILIVLAVLIFLLCCGISAITFTLANLLK